MKIIIKASLLRKFLKYVNKISASERNANLFVSANNDELIIQAADRKLAISATFKTTVYGFEISEPGEILINAGLINELIQKFDDEILNLFVKEKNFLQIFASLSKTNITLTDKAKWEKINFALEGTTVETPMRIFSDINQQLTFAVAKAEAKPIFQGVALNNRNSWLVASATDTLRLVWKQLIPFTKPIELILPIYTINELNRVNDFGCETVKLVYTSNQILIDLDGQIKLLSPLIDGQYPDLTKQLNREFETDLTCSTATLIRAIEICSVFREETSEYTSVSFVFKDGKFKVTSAGAIARGNHHQDVSLFQALGSAQTAQFQSRFLLETLRSFPSKSRTRIQFSEKAGPILLTISGENQVFNLILPVWN